MDVNIPHYVSSDAILYYKGTPFISRFEFSPNKDGWYYVLFYENDALFGCYIEFKDGPWDRDWET